MMSLRFAYLVLEEHPYGREMLRILLEEGFLPTLVIQEVSAVGDLEREKFLVRCAGQPLPPRLNQLLVGKKIPIYSVANHNHPDCRDLLQAAQPDLIVLGGTRIIKPAILEIPPLGTVNSHPGILPWLRGSASVGWALYKNMPVGATVHFIDPGIDTGDIIFTQQLPIRRGDTYETINSRVAILAGQLIARALHAIAINSAPRQPQDRNVGETLPVIPDELLAEAKERLAKGSYQHFDDMEQLKTL